MSYVLNYSFFIWKLVKIASVYVFDPKFAEILMYLCVVFLHVILEISIFIEIFLFALTPLNYVNFTS